MGIKGRHVSVGGTLKVEGNIEVDEINVGGTVEVEGSMKARKIGIGGTLKVDKDATVEYELKVGGVVEVIGELKAGVVKVGGALNADVCSADKIEVGGKVETKKGLKAKTFEIGIGGKVIGPVVAERVKIGREASAEDIYADWLELGEGSSARNIYVREAYLKHGCRVIGELLYVRKLETEREIRTYSTPRKVEKLPEPPI